MELPVHHNGFISRKLIVLLWLMDPSHFVGTHSWAIGLFAYQSFDAIDGKQARRTGMAGPLGEMFDHGQSCPFFREMSFHLCDQDVMQ
jgi:hypothetical protein